eukprot:442775-Hanusia_phi.AAC.2
MPTPRLARKTNRTVALKKSRFVTHPHGATSRARSRQVTSNIEPRPKQAATREHARLRDTGLGTGVLALSCRRILIVFVRERSGSSYAVPGGTRRTYK